MDHVTINFEHYGKKYTCNFSAVYGAGQNVWHLMDDKNFYLGTLRMNKDRWVFDATPNTQELSELANYGLEKNE
jgi:hypothetical protein